MSLGYPCNLDTYKYPNIMAFCAFQIGLEHQLNSPISCCHHDAVGSIHGDGSEKMGTQITATMVNWHIWVFDKILYMFSSKIRRIENIDKVSQKVSIIK